MDKRDIGKLFTTNGENRWKMVWWVTSEELAEDPPPNSSAYHMRNLETNEELTQLYFYPIESKE